VFPVQEPEQASVPVEENNTSPEAGPFPMAFLTQSVDFVKAFAHVPRGAVEIIAVRGAQAKYQ